MTKHIWLKNHNNLTKKQKVESLKSKLSTDT